jgi:FMN reductase
VSTEQRQPKILGLGGSSSRPSNSLAALQIAVAGAQAAGASVESLNFGELDLPFFVPNQPLEAYPSLQAQAIELLLAKVKAADGFLFAAPTYHGTIGGLWKNGIDFLELLPRRPKLYLEGKVVGLIAVGGGQFAAPNTLTALQHVAKALRTWVAPGSVPISGAKKLFDATGQLQDTKLAELLTSLGAQVAEFARLQIS